MSIEADMLKGAYIDPRSGRTTLSEWSREWLDGDPGKRATTRARDDSVLRTHLLPLLGHGPLGSITPLDVRRTVEAMNERLAPATVRTNLAVLAARPQRRRRGRPDRTLTGMGYQAGVGTFRDPFGGTVSSATGTQRARNPSSD
jgi:hypothetical protein